jgi:hypothetical protein
MALREQLLKLNATQRRLYETGVLTDADVESIVGELDAPRLDPRQAVAGPLTANEQALAEGYSSAMPGSEGVLRSVAGEAAGGFLGGASSLGRALTQPSIPDEDYRVEVGPTSSTRDLPSFGTSEEDYYNDKAERDITQLTPNDVLINPTPSQVDSLNRFNDWKQRVQQGQSLEDAFRQGKSIARNEAVADSNPLSQLLVKHGGSAGSSVPLAASLLLGRGRLAKIGVPAAIAIPTITGAGGAAGQVLADGGSGDDALLRGIGVGAIEAGSESILPGGRALVGAGRNVGRALGTEVLSEQVSLAGQTALDKSVSGWEKFAPSTISEYGKASLDTLEATLLFGGPAAGIGGTIEARGNRREQTSLLRTALEDVQKATGGTLDPAVTQGVIAAKAVEEDMQTDMFGPESKTGLPTFEDSTKQREKDLIAPLLAKPLAKPRVRVEPAPVQDVLGLKGGRNPNKKKAAAAQAAAVAKATAQPAKIEQEGVFSVADGEAGINNEQIISHLMSDNKTKAAVRKAIIDKKIEVVGKGNNRGVADMAGGMYDGKKLYLNKDNLTKETFVPTALHEVKHYFDAVDKTDNPRSFKNVVGDKANLDFSKKILGMRGKNPVVDKALNRFKAAETAAGKQPLDEIVTYFVEEAAIARNKGGVLGTAGGIAKDIVSATKKFMSDTAGVDLNPSLNDLSYMSRNMMQTLAKTDMKQAPGTTTPVTSLVGNNAKNAGKYAKAGKGFKGAVDNLQRYEIDSSQSSVRRNVLDRVREDKSGSGTTARFLVDYPELYENYPELKGLKIKPVPKGTPKGRSYAQLDEQTVYLSREALEDPETTRSDFLHEVQHFIQKREGFTQGGSAQEFLDPKDFDTYTKSKNNLEEVLNTVDTDTVEGIRAKLPAAVKKGRPSDVMRAALDLDPQVLTPEERELMGRYRPAQGEFKKNFAKYNAAYQKYLALGGEAEARAVQSRMNMTEAERSEMAFYDSLDQGLVKEDLIDPADPKQGSWAAAGRKADQFSGKFSVADNITGNKDRNFGKAGTGVTLIPAPRNGAVLVHPDSTMGKVGAFWKKALKGTGVPDAVMAHADRAEGASAEAQLIALNAINAVNKEIEITGNPQAAVDFLTKYEAVKTREERLKMATDFKAKYPALFDAYNNARKKMFNYSNQIINEMEKLGPRLTEKQKAVIGSIRENLGNYTTRSYALFGPTKVSQTHRKFLYNTKEGAKILQNARRFAREHVLNIPADVSKIGHDRLEALYDMWVPGSIKQGRPSENLTVDELRAAVSKVADQATSEKLDKEADKFVDDLLTTGIRLNAIGKMAKIYKGERQDMTVITPKDNVPQVIRELWGEQKDPVMNLFSTLVRQGEFLSRIQEQWKMAEDLKGTVLFERSIDGPDQTKLIKLTGESFGPLQGMFTTPEVKDFLDLRREAAQGLGAFLDAMNVVAGNRNIKNISAVMDEGFKLVRYTAASLGGKIKWANVVTNPMNAAYNFAGAPLQMIANGNFKMTNTAKGAKVVFKDMPGAAYKDAGTAELKEIVRNGILDSAFVGEIQDAEFNALVERMIRTGNVKGKKDQIVSRLTDYYSASDLFAKVANYYREKDFIKAFYEKVGQPKSDDEIQRIAAERIKKTNFSFKHAWWPAKALEAGGLTNFLTYNAETFRTIIGNMSLGLGDVRAASALKATNPEAASMLSTMGWSRLAGASVATGGHAAILSAIGALISMALGSEEGENEEAIKKGLAPWELNRILTLVNVRKDGTREYFDVGRLDPFGPINEVIRSALTGDPAKMAEAGKNLFMLNAVLDLAAQQMGLSKQKDPAMSKGNPGAYDHLRDVLTELPGVSETGEGMNSVSSDTVLKLVEAVTPALLENPFNFKGGDPDATGTRMLANALGLKTVKYEPIQSTVNSTKAQYVGTVNDMRKDWSNYVRVNMDLTPEQLATEFNRVATKEYELWQEARTRVEAAYAAGATRRQLAEALKSNQVGNQTQINSLLTGRFTPTTLSVDKMEADKAAELSDPENKGRPPKIKLIKQKHAVIQRNLPRLLRTFKTEEN